MTNDIIFWGNSTYSVNIFRIKNNNQNYYKLKKTESLCRELFKNLKTLPLCSKHIHFLSLFGVKNNDQYKLNQELHSINTCYSTNLHPPTSHLAFQRETYSSGIEVFSHLPSSIKSLYYEM